MTNITRDVQRILDSDSGIRAGLGKGIINKRALAQYIKNMIKGNGSVDAIISAIRRYENNVAEDKRFEKTRDIIRNASISTKTGIAIMALVKDSPVQELLPKLFSIIHYARGEVLRIIQAEETIKVIVDEKNVQKVTDLFNGRLIHVERNLAEINMRLAPVSAKVPGVLALLDTELASNGINIVETVSCVPEILWFIDKKDLLKAHQAFIELIETMRQGG